MRNVGSESQKTYKEKLENGFFNKFMSGNGIEIGYQGYFPGAETILPTAKGFDKDTPGYNGTILPLSDQSQDYVYSSHTLEHISNYQEVIKEWFRVTKIGGFIVTVVPHRDLYEKKEAPISRFNNDHRRFYTPSSLVKEFEESLEVNSFRVRHLQDNDKGFDYSIPPEIHSTGEYEIELVIERIK